MGATTEIAWTDATWNPMTGCTYVSEECRYCYAKATHDKRHKAKVAGKNLPAQYLKPFSAIQCFPERLDQPLHWRKPRRIFCCSTGDLFHKDVPDEFIDRVWAAMLLAHWHTYQVLTKQPQRMMRWFQRRDIYERVIAAADELRRPHSRDPRLYAGISNPARLPAPWIWVGVTAGTQATADERIPLLLQVPAAVRFLSCEPMLEAVNLGAWLHSASHSWDDAPLDWLICGGESGSRARPFDLAWARSLRDQCRAAGTAFFLKQLGRRPVMDRGSFDVERYSHADLDGRNINEWPSDLRVREFPEVRHG